jgi:hypothetical protein
MKVIIKDMLGTVTAAAGKKSNLDRFPDYKTINETPDPALPYREEVKKSI